MPRQPREETPRTISRTSCKQDEEEESIYLLNPEGSVASSLFVTLERSVERVSWVSAEEEGECVGGLVPFSIEEEEE